MFLENTDVIPDVTIGVEVPGHCPQTPFVFYGARLGIESIDAGARRFTVRRCLQDVGQVHHQAVVNPLVAGQPVEIWHLTCCDLGLGIFGPVGAPPIIYLNVRIFRLKLINDLCPPLFFPVGR